VLYRYKVDQVEIQLLQGGVEYFSDRAYF